MSSAPPLTWRERLRTTLAADITIVVAIALGAAASLAMARSDFWLDEVWSWVNAQTITSPWQVFTKIHLDNNHYLNTLWVWNIGRTSDFMLYRIPSLVAGIGTTFLLARIATRHSLWEGVCAALLGGSSYLLAEYASEARGYALSIFFSLLCVDLWQADRARPSAVRGAAFSIAAILGLLSHLTFLFPYAGILAADLVRASKRRPKKVEKMTAAADFFATAADLPRLKVAPPTRLQTASELLRVDPERWRKFASFHAAPIVALGLLWLIDLRHVQIGGGPEYPKESTLVTTIGLIFGSTWHIKPSWIFELSLLALAAFGWTIYSLGRERRDEQIFFSVAIVIAPAAVLIIANPTVFYPRYLLTCVPPFLLIIAHLCARPWAREWVRALGVLAILAIMDFNIARTIHFFPNGRGHYMNAYRDIQRESHKPLVTVGGEYDFRDQNMLAFYGPLLPTDAPELTYSTADQWKAHPPDWLIFETIDEPAPKKAIKLTSGAIYRQTKVYPFDSVVSGLNWYVYRHESK